MKTIEKKWGNTQVMLKKFDGISEMQRWIKNTPVDSGWYQNHARDELHYSWCGAHNYEEASEMLLKGSNVQELKKAINKGKVGYGKKKMTLGVVGCCPNVPAVIAGSPVCMYRMEKTKSPGAYNVYVDVGVHAAITKNEIYDAGVEILIKVLQLSNKYPVNLYVGDFGKHYGKILGSAVQIITAGKAFNVARVSYALTEPGFLRVFGLCIIERNGKFWSSDASSGYGSPLNPYDRKKAVDTVFKNAIVLSTLEVINDGSDAFSEIDKLLK